MVPTLVENSKVFHVLVCLIVLPIDLKDDLPPGLIPSLNGRLDRIKNEQFPIYIYSLKLPVVLTPHKAILVVH